MLYSRPPANLPDTPETRGDMAHYKASALSLDQGVGAVLAPLDARTADPLLDGPIAPPPGARVNLPDQRSPSEPTVTAE